MKSFATEKPIQAGIGDGSLLSIEAIWREFFWPTLKASKYWFEIKTRAYLFVEILPPTFWRPEP
jgi:hypothetical protein